VSHTVVNLLYPRHKTHDTQCVREDGVRGCT
jgi:hypothetical protein